MSGRQGSGGAKVTARVGDGGVLRVRAGGAERVVVPKGAAKTWVLKDGQTVIYSFQERKRGYEGEGEALFRYDAATSKRAQILSAETMVDKVYELTTAGGKTLLCVTLSDGGLGANHVAVVNPDKGTVFACPMARFVKVEPGKIVVAQWADSGRWNGGDNPAGRPTGYHTLVPDRVLGQRAVRDRPWR